MSRFHFANSPDNLQEGTAIEAICGATVPNAHFKAWAECDGQTRVRISVVGICRKCRELAMTIDGPEDEREYYLDFTLLQHRLVYVVEEGEAA